MSRDNSAQRMTTSPHEQALLLDGVAGRPAVAHNGWPNGQKTVDAETLSGSPSNVHLVLDFLSHYFRSRDVATVFVCRSLRWFLLGTAWMLLVTS